MFLYMKYFSFFITFFVSPVNLEHVMLLTSGFSTRICNYDRSLQPFSQDYGLACHTTHVMCVNFMREWRNLQFNVHSERQIFEKLFMAILFTLRVFPENC